VDAEGAVDAGAVEAEDGAEGDGGPLGVFHAAIAALVVAGDGFDHGLVAGGHLNHVGSLLVCVLVGWIGSVWLLQALFGNVLSVVLVGLLGGGMEDVKKK